MRTSSEETVAHLDCMSSRRHRQPIFWTIARSLVLVVLVPQTRVGYSAVARRNTRNYNRIWCATMSCNMANGVEIKWLTDLEDDDYPAAGSYLSLLYDEQAAANYVEQLRKASVSEFKAKDIFRASGLSLLGVSNSHVEHDQKKILACKSLSPLLLVRAAGNQTVIIADGYHRMCAVYS